MRVLRPCGGAGSHLGPISSSRDPEPQAANGIASSYSLLRCHDSRLNDPDAKASPPPMEAHASRWCPSNQQLLSADPDRSYEKAALSRGGRACRSSAANLRVRRRVGEVVFDPWIMT